MGSYVSARFETDDLTASDDGFRVVVRAVDQGEVPPKPSTSYFPTFPSELTNFIVVDYGGGATGENFDRVATLSDIDSLPIKPLNAFFDTSVDFQAAGVSSGDILEVVPESTPRWTSEEYPGTTFKFSISSVDLATRLTVSNAFPAFESSMSWEIKDSSGTVILSGSGGGVRREGLPPGGTELLTDRFNAYFDDVVAALNFKASVKAGLRALANESTTLSFTPETFTAEPTS